MSNNEPNAYSEGGIVDADTLPQADQTKPAALVSKEVG